MSTNNSWNNQIADALSVITLNSGTNTISISTDASATTVNIATGGAAKTLTIGSTNSTSSTDIQYGTGDFSLASASGDVVTATDAGEILAPLQPAFLVVNNSDAANITGDGTTYTTLWATEIFDQGSDFASNTFTAPITGRYQLSFAVLVEDASAAYTFAYSGLVTSNREYRANNTISGFGIRVHVLSVLADMDTSDTATITIRYGGGSKVVDQRGNTTEGAVANYFSGCLVC